MVSLYTVLLMKNSVKDTVNPDAKSDRLLSPIKALERVDNLAFHAVRGQRRLALAPVNCM